MGDPACFLRAGLQIEKAIDFLVIRINQADFDFGKEPLVGKPRFRLIQGLLAMNADVASARIFVGNICFIILLAYSVCKSFLDDTILETYFPRVFKK